MRETDLMWRADEIKNKWEKYRAVICTRQVDGVIQGNFWNDLSRELASTNA